MDNSLTRIASKHQKQWALSKNTGGIEYSQTCVGGIKYETLYDTGFFSGFFPSLLSPKDTFPYEIDPVNTDPAEVPCKFQIE